MLRRPIFPAVVAAALLVSAAGFFYWRRTRPRRLAPEPVRPAGAGALIPAPLYKQWDPRWARSAIGGSGEKMREVGCAVCCAAMVLSHYGVETTPGELNAYLRERGGYTGRGWIRWEKAAEMTGGRVEFVYEDQADLRRLAEELAAGNPVIAKVTLPGGVPHWVLVVGRQKGEYLVNDPLGPEARPVSLSRFGGKLLQMRIYRKR